MIHEIANEVYRQIREYGQLSHEQVGKAVGRSHDTIRRWEKSEQQGLPKRDQEEKLVKKAKLTRLAFGEIMCKVLTEFVGRRFVMIAPDQWVPSLPMTRTLELYSRHRERLSLEVQQAIEEMLCHGRSLDADAEQACRIYEKQCVRLIEQAIGDSDPSTPDTAEA